MQSMFFVFVLLFFHSWILEVGTLDFGLGRLAGYTTSS